MRKHPRLFAPFGILAPLGLALVLLLGLFVFMHAGSLSARAAEPALSPEATGNLSISQFSMSQFAGVVAGDPISFTIFASWEGDAPAQNVVVTDALPPEITLTAADPPPSRTQGGTLYWDYASLDPDAFEVILVEGVVQADLANKTTFTNTLTIAGDVVDQDPSDNVDEAVITVELPAPDLWLFKWGQFEDDTVFFRTEQGVRADFSLLYMNWSPIASPETTLVDTLPEGVAFVSAEPAPDRIEGQQLTWELGRVEGFGVGEVMVHVRPADTGSFVNTSYITSTVGDRDPSDNDSNFSFDVVSALPPRVLRPNFEEVSGSVIVGKNVEFRGLARAGATVTVYEGKPEGCWGDFSLCEATPLGSAIAGADRAWTIQPTVELTTGHEYSLYFRAEYNGDFSAPDFNMWTPVGLIVDPRFEEAGWDMDAFSVESGGHTVNPGGLGGTIGMTPDEPITLTIRQNIRDDVPGDPELRAYHDIRVVVHDGSETYTTTVQPEEFIEVSTNQAAAQETDTIITYDTIYVQKGFDPGARVEVWCRPVYWPEEPGELPLVGLVWTLCSEYLIDPAGYVYDLNAAGTTYEWPAVPPDRALITNATVTATIRSGDDAWDRWEAEKTGQINPQVTDFSTPDGIKVPGYYAFYVPPGQYQVQATAPGCTAYVSPILTVVDAPIFHNVGMRCSEAAQVGIRELYLPMIRR